MKAARKTGLLLICFALLITLVLQTKSEGASYKFNMAYLNFGDCADYTEYVDKTQRSLSEVSPNYFALNSDGSLALTYAVSKSFVDNMHERQIAVVPYLSNDWSREKGKAAMKNRVKLAEALADAVRKYNLDGVNIDIENLTVTEREATVDFVRLLRQLMPGKRIVMSVAANPWGISTGWQGSYDYARLAEYCDYLMYMCYDEHYYGGSAGPVSSMSYIEKPSNMRSVSFPGKKSSSACPFTDGSGRRTGAPCKATVSVMRRLPGLFKNTAALSILTVKANPRAPSSPSNRTIPNLYSVDSPSAPVHTPSGTKASNLSRRNSR